MEKIDCKSRDEILHAEGRYEGWDVYSSLTDMSGDFGEPRIETTWGRGDVRVRDIRRPAMNGDGPDVAPCEHYKWQDAGE